MHIKREMKPAWFEAEAYVIPKMRDGVVVGEDIANLYKKPREDTVKLSVPESFFVAPTIRVDLPEREVWEGREID